MPKTSAISAISPDVSIEHQPVTEDTDTGPLLYTGWAKKVGPQTHGHNSIKSEQIWQSYKQERDFLVHFLRLLAVHWPGAQSHETTTLLLVTVRNIHRLKKFRSQTQQ